MLRPPQEQRHSVRFRTPAQERQVFAPAKKGKKFSRRGARDHPPFQVPQYAGAHLRRPGRDVITFPQRSSKRNVFFSTDHKMTPERRLDLCAAQSRAGTCSKELKSSGGMFHYANLYKAHLTGSNFDGANMEDVNLSDSVFLGSSLKRASLLNADVMRVSFEDTNLDGVRGLVKRMGVEVGNFYWKRINYFLRNRDYQFYVGLNELRKGEKFAGDERLLCSYPGFYFASRSWCASEYPYHPYEAKIRIPEGARINEPWGTDGKASADKIEIVQVFDARTGKDVTKNFVRKE